MIDHLMTLLSENDFLQGGAILAALSYIGYRIREVPGKISTVIRRYSILEVSFDAGTDQFEALAAKLIEKYSKSNSGKFLSIDQNDKSLVIPGGSRWFRQGRCLINTVMSKRNLENSYSQTSVTFELDIDVYGWNKKEVLRQMIDEAMEEMRKDNQSLHVRIAGHDYWDKACSLRPRTFDTVFSRHKKSLMDDLDKFTESEEKYNKRGIPYRRGYLLHGPPGTGKTTILQAVANYLGRDLRILNLNSISASSLQSLLSRDGMLICIEDIDAVTKAVETRDSGDDPLVSKPMAETKSTSVTLADILNAIDGVTSGHDNILMMTTNHPEKLDPALLRPGRIDVKIELGYVNQEEFDEMCLTYYGEDSFEVPEKITPAEIQGAMQQNQESYEDFKQDVLEKGK